jgi:A/G-specific adenine glycosylase
MSDDPGDVAPMDELRDQQVHGVFAAKVVAWQRTHGRHTLPWQQTRDPYRVWLSEIMLQQTQVATVLGYYQRFLDRFPTIAALAAAPLDDVFGLWSGLGYYSRARNLHRCAQEVVDKHGGRMPPSAAQLQELPGIGRSTAAAIAAFCFGERVAILDGNVKRVLTRVLAFDGDLATGAAEKALWAQATGLLPHDDVEGGMAAGIASYTQGLMDLGATVCVARSPHCLLCPVQHDCIGRRLGEPERYPVKTRKTKRGRREHAWLWLRHGDRVFLTQRPDRGIWAGLWSLPEFESVAVLDALAQRWPGEGEELATIEHTLTHLDWRLLPVRWDLPADAGDAEVAAVAAALPAGRWMSLACALDMGLPAPVRKLLVG